MKKASWILLTVVGVAITLLSLVSAVHAYRTSDDYRIGGSRVSKVAGGDAGLATALRGIRGTSAAYAAAYGVLLLAIVLGPYRRGDVWAWKALLAIGEPLQAHRVAGLALERDATNKKARAVFESTAAAHEQWSRL